MNQLSQLAFSASKYYNAAVGFQLFLNLAKIQVQIMTTTVESVNAAVTLIIKAAILAARFSGRTRKRNLKKLSKMDADEKDKENGLRPDDVYYDSRPGKPNRNAKTAPCNIERQYFSNTRITGYRLKRVA